MTGSPNNFPFHTHLVGGFKCGVGDLSHRQLLVVGLLGGDDGGVGGEREVDTWVGHQVGLELGQIHVEGTVEAQGGSDGGHDLADQTVEVGVGGALDVQVTAADVVDGLVVDHEGAVGVLQGGVGGQDGVVGLDNSGGDLNMKNQSINQSSDVCMTQIRLTFLARHMSKNNYTTVILTQNKLVVCP